MPDINLQSSWIDFCATHHKECGPIAAKPLPTRLLDTGKLSYEDPKLVETVGQFGIYVTLSHCWGGWRGLVTNDSNYQNHLQGIPLCSMPRTFRDAIQVVRELGWQYLWIDSLCIIQGNAADWETEAGRMCSVYANSCLTIAGPDASNPEAGLLHPRSPSPYHSWDILECQNGAKISLISLMPECAHPPRHDRPLYDTVLGDRGWCLQERLLSPRVLYFRRFYLYFECREHDFSELSWQWVRPIEFYNMIPKTQLDGENEDPAYDYFKETGANHYSLGKRVQALHESWWRLVENFSCRHLSYQSDKLPAIQGLA